MPTLSPLKSDTSLPGSFVQPKRLLKNLATVALIGKLGDTGVKRQALTQEDIDAKAWLIQQARSRGFTIEMDGIANLYIRRRGRQKNGPIVMTGSHLDSQPTGGRYDGAYGVIAGFEALEALEDAGIETKHPIELVAWTNEEGGRFAPGAMGSQYFTDHSMIKAFNSIQDADGIYFRDALEKALIAHPGVPIRKQTPDLKYYLEAHIEQGPLLESTAHTIGVVSGIQGVRWFTIEVLGSTNHAGTTPLRYRQDALQTAVVVINKLNTLTSDPKDLLRFTIGKIEVEPNSPNTISDRVVFTIDLRHPCSELLDELSQKIMALSGDSEHPCTVKVTQTMQKKPCLFDERVVQTIHKSAAALDYSKMDIASGAFHDALFLSECCPSGMIFIPCCKGISHHPDESITTFDAEAGARVLANSLAWLAA